MKLNVSYLSELKRAFYEWCGVLSIDEIASNPSIIRAIERFERSLLAAGAYKKEPMTPQRIHLLTAFVPF